MALSAFATRSRALNLASRSKVASRRSLARAAEPESAASNGAAAPAPAMVYFGGKEYTEEQWAAAVASGSVASAAPAAPAAAAVSADGAISLVDAMSFSGPAPEIINGRLSMLGFLAAVAAEFASDESVLQQWASEPTGVAAVFALIIAASFPPLLAGRKESLGPFTPQAELQNGRAAMVGFAALLIIEGVKHGALF